VKLVTHLHLVLRSKNEWSYMSTSPIRHQLKALGQLYLYLSSFFHSLRSVSGVPRLSIELEVL
jgi:hypothetical protein